MSSDKKNFSHFINKIILGKDAQKWVDNKYIKETEKKINIKKENIRNNFGRKSNLIGSLKIERFIILECINLKKLKLTELDIIDCPQLTSVDLSELITLKSLFVSKCPKLTKLDLSHSKLTELTDLDVNNLIELDCSNTSIERLGLNRCPNLIKLNCSNNNKLINLDISSCSKLKYLDCSNTSKLTSLDLSNCPCIPDVLMPPNFGDKINFNKKNFKNILVIGHTGSGKSTLANVLTGTEVFKETGYGVSETKNFQKGDFEWEGTKYRVIDTVGIGDTKLSINKVLNRIEEAVHSVPEGINQILFVVSNNSTYEISTLGRLGLLRSYIFEHTTIVRTKFNNFMSRKECEKDKEILCKENETNAKIVKLCKGLIHVDNPSTNISNYDVDDDEPDINVNKINERTRKKSRNILLEHLEKVCKGKTLQIEHINIHKTS